MASLRSNCVNCCAEKSPLSIPTLTRGGTMVKDDYVQVIPSVEQPKFSAGEWKAKMRNVHVGRPIGKAGRAGGKLSETRVTLVQDLSGATAANTALALVVNMTPFTANDWTAYASVYDECKVHAITVKGTYSYSAQSTALNARTIITWAYDPIDATAPASNVDQLSASQHAGPWVITSSYTGVAAGAPVNQPGPLEVSVVPGGFHSKKFVVPKGRCRSAANVNTFGDEWADTADAGDYWGFLKMFIEAGGAAGVIAYRHFTFYDVSFRSRH